MVSSGRFFRYCGFSSYLLIKAFRICGEGKKSMIFFWEIQLICRSCPKSWYSFLTKGNSSSIIHVFTILLPVTGLMTPAADLEALKVVDSSITINEKPAFCRYQQRNVPQIPWPITKQSIRMLLN